MKSRKLHSCTRALFSAVALILLSLAHPVSADGEKASNTQAMRHNPVSYFEIPVTMMDRAVAFYEAVFGVSLTRTEVDGHEMALFPFDEEGQGITGALATGDSYVPSRKGPRIYFSVDNIQATLDSAVSNGGSIAYPRTRVGKFWVAEFVDSEGNQIALTSAAD